VARPAARRRLAKRRLYGRLCPVRRTTATSSDQYLIRARLRYQPPGRRGTSKDRFEWKPIAARLGRDGVPRNYPCDPVGENIITIEGNHIALTTIATGWKSLLDRNR
jgi:hypothetical protein